MPTEEETTLDTQEELTEETTIDEAPVTEEADEPVEDDPSTTEESDDEPLDLGFEPETEEEVLASEEPFRDVKELIKNDPEKALTRVAEVEKGFIKVQAQNAEMRPVIEALSTTLEQVKNDDANAINNLENWLYEQTGWTFEALANRGDGAKSANEPNRPNYGDKRIEQLEQQIKDIQNEKAATSWITSHGTKISAQVEKVTGLKFPPELLWQARQHMPKSGATPSDVELAVMRTDPRLYKEAVAARDGSKSSAPKSATIPNGRAATKTNFEHTPQGWAAAREAKLARGGT